MHMSFLFQRTVSFPFPRDLTSYHFKNAIRLDAKVSRRDLQLKMPGGGCSVTRRQFSSSLLSPQSFCWLQTNEPRYKHLPLVQVNLHSVKAFVAWKPASCILLPRQACAPTLKLSCQEETTWTRPQVTSILACRSPSLCPVQLLVASDAHLPCSQTLRAGSTWDGTQSHNVHTWGTQSRQPSSQRVEAMVSRGVEEAVPLRPAFPP